VNTGKAVLAVVWALCIAAFFMPADSTAAVLGRGLFWLLIVVHAIECVVFLPALRRAGGPLLPHLAKTFAYGFLHLREVRGS
jgi:uncharacterized protein YhhL (DUF1145 family)